MRFTFVSEFGTYAKNFKENPVDPVCAVNVSSCTLMEICNRDDNNKRTAFSLTHYTTLQLTGTDGLLRAKESVPIVFENFVKHGGDVQSAEIRLYGGCKSKHECRRNIRRALLEEYNLHDAKEPLGHHCDHEDETWDYLFSSDSVTFRKADMRFDDCSKDVFSANLHTINKRPDITKVIHFVNLLDSQLKMYLPVYIGSQRHERIIKTYKDRNALPDQPEHSDLFYELNNRLIQLIKVSIVNDESKYIDYEANDATQVHVCK